MIKNQTRKQMIVDIDKSEPMFARFLKIEKSIIYGYVIGIGIYVIAVKSLREISFE